MSKLPLRTCLAALVLSAAPALARDALSAAEFEAHVTGRVLSYLRDGVEIGREDYRPGRLVRWTFGGQQCEFGRWYPLGDSICFDYEGVEAPQCWRYYRGPDGLVAESVSDPPGTSPYTVRGSEEPLVCRGPRIGS